MHVLLDLEVFGSVSGGSCLLVFWFFLMGRDLLTCRLCVGNAADKEIERVL